VPLQWLAPQFGMASLCRSAHSLELFLRHSFLNLSVITATQQILHAASPVTEFKSKGPDSWQRYQKGCINYSLYVKSVVMTYGETALINSFNYCTATQRHCCIGLP